MCASIARRTLGSAAVSRTARRTAARGICVRSANALRRASSTSSKAFNEAEVEELLERRRYERRSGNVPAAHRDGYDPERVVTTGAGPRRFRRPRVRGAAHASALVPRYRRRLPVVDATLHKLWVEGLAHRDFEPALRVLFGADAPLSPATIARVNAEYLTEFDAWKSRSLANDRFPYLWVDGVFLGAGSGDERRVLLTVIGADADGNIPSCTRGDTSRCLRLVTR